MMLQFDEERVVALRARARKDRSVVDTLLKDTAELRSSPLMIQAHGRATWSHYYACPDHGVKLLHELARPDSYRCPVDGRSWSGEPYEGAWWRITNGKNADGARDLAYLWLLTGEDAYRELALEILVGYAARYPAYQVHGNIPHNGPGKANCQTLCEGMFLRSLAQAWDVLRGTAAPDAVEAVERDLFSEGGTFLASHLAPQRHNHEVLVAGALGMVGVLLDRGDLVAAARDADYGLAWQLRESVLPDGCWFEGSPHYHAFALEAYFVYETFARGTPYTLWSEEGYRRMLRFGASILRSDGAPPLLNDGASEDGPGIYPELFEYAYAQDGSEEWAEVLRFLYASTERGGTTTFLHGLDALAPGRVYAPVDYHDESGGSGLTILRGRGDEYLLFRHGPFGGEHDHYDRLGISYYYSKKRVLPDLSTIAYGSPMHYRYYKNSATHSVPVLDGTNHPPADARLLRREDRRDGILLAAEVQWSTPFRSDFRSHYREEWADAPYRGARFRRTLLKTEEYFLDVVDVRAPGAETIDLNTLIAAELPRNVETQAAPESFSAFTASGPYGAPYAYLSAPRVSIQRRGVPLRFPSEGFILDVAVLDPEAETILARGPDNPPQRELSYLVRRVRGRSARFIAVYGLHGPSATGLVGTELLRSAPGELSVAILLGDGRRQVHNLEV